MPTSATAVPTGFTDTLVASIGSPTALAFTPGGQLLVTTQLGDVRVVQNGTLLPAPALDLGSVLCTASEQGLLGVAVDPSFTSNGFVYLYYTRNKSGTCVNRVSRFTMSGSTISMASESVLVDEIPSPGGNHNAGDVRFGNDGYLYISVGDGGCDWAGNSGCAGANDAARGPARTRRQDPPDHEHRRHPALEPLPGSRDGAVQRHRPNHSGQQVPGDVRLGAAEPVPHRLRPEHDGDALLHQRRRPGRLGGGRPRRRRRGLRLERA